MFLLEIGICAKTFLGHALIVSFSGVGRWEKISSDIFQFQPPDGKNHNYFVLNNMRTTCWKRPRNNSWLITNLFQKLA